MKFKSFLAFSPNANPTADDASILEDAIVKSDGGSSGIDFNKVSWEFTAGALETRAFIKWKFTIPIDFYIERATIILYLGSTFGPFPATFNVHRVTGSWSWDTITWANQPAVAAQASFTHTLPSGTPTPQYYVYNSDTYPTILADIRSWIDGTNPNQGWRWTMVRPTPDTATGVFYSSQNKSSDAVGTMALPPILLLEGTSKNNRDQIGERAGVLVR